MTQSIYQLNIHEVRVQLLGSITSVLIQNITQV